MAEDNFEGMPLTQAVRTWLDGEGWDDENEVHADRTVSSVATSITISDQSFRLYLEVFESDERLFVYFYSTYNVPRQRVEVALRIINRINLRLAFGRLAFQDDGEGRPIQFKVSVDVEGSALSPVQVNTLVGLGVVTFRNYGNVLAAACLTKRTVDDLWADFLVDEEDRDPSSGCPVLRVLN